MFGAELILDKLVVLVFLFFWEGPRWAFGLGLIEVGVVNVLALVLADLKPEVASFLSGYRLEEIVLVGWSGGFG